MDANTYQKEAQRTLISSPDRDIPLEELQIVWAALQIAVTAGKLVEHLKKGVFHQHGLDDDFIISSIDTIQELITAEDIPTIPDLTGEQIMELWITSGLVGEASEIAEMLINSLTSGEEVSDSEYSKELGDLAWYWSSKATQKKLALNDVLIGNVTKLQKRYRNGYSSEASKNRVE